MQESLTFRDFGRRKGVSRQAVARAAGTGRLHGCLGRDAKGQPCIIDVELADREWVENAKPRGRRQAAPGLTSGAKALVEDVWAEEDVARTDQKSDTADDDRRAAEAADLSALSPISLAEAHRILTIERALKLRLERHVAEGRLVPLAVVTKEAFEAKRIVRESILNITARISAELHAEPDLIRFQIKLDGALREALNAAADALLAAGTEVLE
jgi:hypothetical protein